MLANLLLSLLSVWTLAIPSVQLLPFTTDLNRNGIPETLVVTTVVSDKFTTPCSLYTIQVLENGQEIWRDEAYPVHAGYNAVFLCRLNGEDYLLGYHPFMFQGFGDYHYELFSLEDGQPTSYQKNRIYFDIVSGPMHESFNAVEINAFMEEINLLLADSIPLINSDEPLLETFEKNGCLRDDLWWLEFPPERFLRDETASLLENLERFQAEIFS